MRLIGLLIVLTIIALMVARQLHTPGSDKPAPLATQPSGVPQVPQKADQVPEFRKKMNDFVDKQNAEQKQRIEQMNQQ